MPSDSACRVRLAVREERGTAKPWVFYLLNDGASFDTVRVASETNVARDVGPLSRGSFREIWHDDDDAAEVNISIDLDVTSAGAVHRVTFELPKLYHRGGHVTLPLVGGVGVVIVPTE